MTKCRILVDWNITPICSPNPKWVDDGKQTDPDVGGNYHWIRYSDTTLYAANTLKMEKMFVVYDGTLNYSGGWCNDDLTLKSLTYDAQRKIYNADQSRYGQYSMPPQELQVKMCATISNIENPFPLDGTKSPRYLPIMFDFENLSVYQSEVMGVQNMTNAINWAKSLKADSAVSAFAWPSNIPNQDTYDRNGWQAYADATDYLCGGLYAWDCVIANPNAWYDEMNMQLKLFDRFFKHIPRLAVMCPLYQVYFPQNDASWVVARNNQPIDPTLWKKMMQFYVDHDFDILVWLGATPLNTQTQYLLQTANSFQR